MYVVEGTTASVTIIRDPRSTYQGAFLFDYVLNETGSATEGVDYPAASGTEWFPPNTITKTINVVTTSGGGVTINGVDVVLSGLETAEYFEILLSNIQPTDVSGSNAGVYPQTCIDSYFLTDQYPSGILSDISPSPRVPIPIVILDSPQTSSTSYSLGGGCTLQNVLADMQCTDSTNTLVIDEVQSTEPAVLLEVWNSNTGELIQTVPVANLPVEIDVTDHFTDAGYLHILYQTCGCCLELEYACGCEIIDVTGELVCCEIQQILGELTCCEITNVEGRLECS